MGLAYKRPTNFYIFSLFLILHTLLVSPQATSNTITQGQLLRDGQTILSSGRVFELGFFSPWNSTSRYVGIWYYRVPIVEVVWVANRENPISGNSGVFGIANNGDLVVSDGNGVVVWSTNSSLSSSVANSTAVLKDNGNLILSGGDSNALWQSYDHPTDTFLSDMKIHVNRSFISWKSASDPSYGDCTMVMDPQAAPERSGHWNGSVFAGGLSFGAVFSYGCKLTTEPEENKHNTYPHDVDTSSLMNLRMRWDGIVEHLSWDKGGEKRIVRLEQPSTECISNECGNFGICSTTESPRCSCVQGFRPNDIDQWNAGNWSGGCVRRKPLQCSTNGSLRDLFVQVNRTLLPDEAETSQANTKDCKEGCFWNCSCKAYAFVDGVGCMTWSTDSIDVKQSQESGGTIYIRVANSESGKVNPSLPHSYNSPLYFFLPKCILS